MTRSIASFIVIISMLASGCTMQHKEQMVSNYSGRGNIPLQEAPFKGDYVLYRLPQQGNYITVFRGRIDPPDRVGFQKATDGSLDAIAGKTNVPLEDGYYTWKGTPDRGQFDAKYTAVQVGTVVIVVVVAAVLIAGTVLAF